MIRRAYRYAANRLNRFLWWATMPPTLEQRVNRVAIFCGAIPLFSMAAVRFGLWWHVAVVACMIFVSTLRAIILEAPMVRNVRILGTVVIPDGNPVRGEVVNCHISQAPLREPIENSTEPDWSDVNQ